MSTKKALGSISPTVLDKLLEGVLLVDNCGTIIYINKRARKILKIPAKSKCRRTLDSVFKSENPEILKPLTGQCSSKKPIHAKIEYLEEKKDKQLQVTAHIINETVDGAPYHVLILLKDVSDMWTLNVRERELHIQLRKNYINQMENLRQISQSIAHEIRNPLVAIGGYANLLLKKFPADISPDARKYMEYIEHDAERLNKIVAQVDQYTRIDDVAFSKQNMKPVFEKILAYSKKEAKKTQLSFDAACDFLENYVVNIDSAKLIAALKKVVMHSMHLAKTGTEYYLSLRFEPYQIFFGIEFTTEIISEQDIEFLFNPFYSAENAEKMNFDLASAQRIIILHGGLIKAEWLPRKRTYFKIIIPREKRMQPR